YQDRNSAPFQATFRSPFVAGAPYHSASGWVEDQVSRGRVTLSLGVRYDHMLAISPNLPARDAELNPTGGSIKGLGDMFTWNPVAPRVGFNVKLTKDDKTLLRGNYGRAYRPVYTNDFTGVHPGQSPITTASYNSA